MIKFYDEKAKPVLTEWLKQQEFKLEDLYDLFLKVKVNPDKIVISWIWAKSFSFQDNKGNVKFFNCRNANERLELFGQQYVYPFPIIEFANDEGSGVVGYKLVKKEILELEPVYVRPHSKLWH